MVDKPEGITSHDVVAMARRILGQPRIGHTGTLDPFATGVLPLALGKATRLARFLSAADKSYDATVRFGLVTDTYDITGTVVGRSDARPSSQAILEAIEALRGERLQRPPNYSAKKVGGRRAYDMARQQVPVELQPAAVTLHQVDVVGQDRDTLSVRLTCSTGFYVRSFAHDLGERLGTGGCLEALRRTRAGQFTIADAVTPGGLDSPGGKAAVRPLSSLLPDFPAVTVGLPGRARLGHGQGLRPEDLTGRLAGADSPDMAAGAWVRVLDHDLELLGLGQFDEGRGILLPHIVLT